ncbi:6,7-dimethyl-8-ribityllumazine synthase [Chlamydiales bacterium STE3]|nr:6,7-dimethyl-8-ribityllumazine synthase [Chlamydiales bacterium STE3]
MKEFRGKFNAKGLKFAIICARFNELITKNLLEGAQQAFDQFEVENNQITVVWVPGAFEIPLIAKQLAENQHYDALLCLGAVIRGATPHFDYVCGQVASGIAKCSYENNIPIIFSVLTTDTIEQALERSGIKAGNKGFEGAQSAIEMANLMSQLKKAKS